MITLDKKKIGYGLVVIALACVIFASGFTIGKHQAVCKVCKPETLDFSLFWDAYDKLKTNFIDPGKITDQTVIYGAISGMTKSLGDPYTDFFDPAQAKLFKQDLAGSFDGIGAEIGIKKGQLTIIAPLKDTPGYRAGLKSGDQIIKINGKSTADLAVDEAVALIRGKKGTQVTLTIFRDGWTQTKDFTITRETIKVNSVDWELKNGDVAYIKIHQFDQSLSGDFKTIAHDILQSPAKKIIIDLRDNPGGYLETCQEIAGWFLKPGQMVTVEDFGKDKSENVEYKAEGNAAFANYPIVVLMNKGSASASEILAGALHDDRGVKLVGEKSFGKGSVQEVLTLADGSFLKITIAKWLTPKGNSISEVGLEPDVKVAPSESTENPDNDPQLQKALEIISNLH